MAINFDLVTLLSPTVVAAPPVRVRLNAGYLIDIPSGEYVKQPDGTYVLNGGLHQTVGIAGLPNTFKSTFMHTLTVSVVSRLILNNVPCNITTYDTENTAEHKRLLHLAHVHSSLRELGDLFKIGLWSLTNKNSLNGTEWWAAIRNMVRVKVKESKRLMVDTPLKDDNGKPYKVIAPSFNHVDSLTTFGGKDSDEVDEKVDLSDPKGLTKFMKEGLAKARFLTALPKAAERSNTYFILTAHVGDKPPELSSGPSYGIPDKKIPTIKSNQRYKGVTDNFFSLLGGIWQTHRVKGMFNKDKLPLYPVDKDDDTLLDTDLMQVSIQLMRSKSSGDGIMIDEVLSKTEGFLEALSAFHYLRENHYYGLEGNQVTYACALLPDVTLQRTNIRKRIKDVPLLSRALYICAEMLQIYTFRKYAHRGFYTNPAKLYSALEEKGYDWTTILTARGWHSLGEVPKGILTITTMDLLAIYAGELDLPAFKKQVKKEGGDDTR